VAGLTEVTKYSAFYTVQDHAMGIDGTTPLPNLHEPVFRWGCTR
jgi:hypothetical protein